LATGFIMAKKPMNTDKACPIKLSKVPPILNQMML
jgi:hypothetical protein